MTETQNTRTGKTSATWNGPDDYWTTAAGRVDLLATAARSLHTSYTETPDALDALKRLEGIEHYVRTARGQLVADAREGGATWEQVGEVFGCSKQAAQERFRAR